MKLIALLLISSIALTASNPIEKHDYNLVRSFRARQLLQDIFHNHERLQETRKLTATINEYMDILVQEMAQYVKANNLDPVELPDVVKGFSHKILWVTYHGELKLTKGNLYDLAKIQRFGDCDLRYDSLFLNVRVPIAFNKLLAEFDYSAKFMNLGPSGQLDGTINKAIIYIDVLLDLKALKIYIQDFQIDKLGHIDIEFKGHALVDWFFDILSDLTTTIFHGVFKGVLETQVQDLVETIVDTINADLENTFG